MKFCRPFPFWLLLTLLLSGCGKAGKPEKMVSAAGDQPNPIRTILVEKQATTDAIDLPAKVQADPARVIRIFPPASGRMIALKVRLGDRVKQGQAIAILQSSDIAAARADFEKAQIEVDRSQRAESRAAIIYEHEVMSQKDYEDARAQADAARTEQERARQRLRLLGANENSRSDRLTIVAPQNGVVLDISASAGELSKSLDNSTPLATIADLSTVWIVGDLYEKDLSYARPGEPVTISVEAYPGESWKGKIASISDALDPNTRTLKFRVVLENPQHRLKPEMFAVIHLMYRLHQVILLPASALIREGNSTSVYVRGTDGNFDRRSVTLGPMHGDKIEILTGLNGGEVVVIEGAELLRGTGAGQS